MTELKNDGMSEEGWQSSTETVYKHQTADSKIETCSKNTVALQEREKESERENLYILQSTHGEYKLF